MSFIEFESVYKRYQTGEIIIPAADGVSFAIEKGEFCLIVGASGAGKSTVLNLLGGMDTVDDGKIRVAGKPITKLTPEQLIDYRRFDVGFVFQFYNLIPNLTALENVELASQIAKKPLSPENLLKKVGLAERMDNFPSQLSGGEQQRVSIARALAKNPKLLLCDEPTGALDYETGIQVLKLIKKVSEIINMTVVIITHNHAIAPIADRIITMKSGKIAKIEINDTPMPVERIEW